ncbi:MAG: AMP-binding protein [Sulfurospirillaceae bacterium]|nr:AMP-binding protein [Sulfurospirillaceae bacterium]MDD3462121.1 AMP-binding protein [Sulfurospirillaceae bacterium]
MKITILHDNQSKTTYYTQELCDDSPKGILSYIPSSTKEQNAIDILRAYLCDAKPILYDKENLSLAKSIEALDGKIFEDIDFSAMFFTSGSTGFPTGAFKSKENIQTDMDALIKIFGSFKASTFVSTVPFIHIYGFLVGLLLPLKLDANLIFKEHFLPHDLLAFSQPKTIVVTTPLYIKALLQLGESKDLSKTIFISSTGPLSAQIAKEFTDTFHTTLIQIFGSTETGSIAYKKQDDLFWTPFDGVEVTLNDEGLLHVSSPFISKILWNNGFTHTNGAIQTFDYATLQDGKFQLIGRSQNILKVAGKRYATAQIEEILEKIEGVKKALVQVKHTDKALKDESVLIFLESDKLITLKEVKAVIKTAIGKLNFPIELKVVDKIPTTLVGKKIMPL